MVWLLAFLLGLPPADPAISAAPDARELVRQSVRNGERAWRDSLNYQCIRRELDRAYDSSGTVKSVDDDLYEVIPLGYGVTFDKLVTSNGEPLSPVRRANVEDKLDHLRDESPSLKRAHFAKEESQRSYMREVPDAFDFRITGVENLPTGPAWVIEATPRPGYQPQSRYAHMFHAMRGTLWIDQKDLQWVKADAIAMQPVSFGFFIARLARGSHIILEQMKLPDGAWAPQSIEARADARMLVLWRHNFEEDVTFSHYRRADRAQTASRNPVQ